MNYRHAYHAGNFADVAKHVTLMALLGGIVRRPKPYTYLDTHAGAGVYDLQGGKAQLTAEHREGITRLWNAAGENPPDALKAYLLKVAELNDTTLGGPAPRLYPGSPWLARAMARPGDKLMYCELHPDDAARLKECFQGDKTVSVQMRDGYQGVRAMLPPLIQRGLVLIDPSYEDQNEYQLATDALIRGHHRWPGGVFALWYPLKEPAAVKRLHARLRDSGIRKVLVTECRQVPPDHPPGLHGGGIVVINPPWLTPETIRESLDALVELLAPGLGSARVEWLVPE